MTTMTPDAAPAQRNYPPALARELVLDELFDLELYRVFHAQNKGDLGDLLADLVKVEERHHKFWEDFFDLRFAQLDFGRRVKLRVLASLCRVLGPSAVHLTLEAIEIYGIRKYLRLWKAYRDEPLGGALKQILEDEMEHEDEIVSRMTERKINPDRIRNIFLGFNDGLVEILGAVSGFFAAFQDSVSVLAAGSAVAVAGAFSMAAGAFASIGSETEIRKIEEGKAEFLGKPHEGTPAVTDSPARAALVVGTSYLLGALVPILPVFLGARGIAASVLAAGVMIILVSTVLAFLSGMNVRRRIGLNLLIIALAVAITYAIGLLAREAFGVGV